MMKNGKENILETAIGNFIKKKPSKSPGKAYNKFQPS
jgi:hypothetical protein